MSHLTLALILTLTSLFHDRVMDNLVAAINQHIETSEQLEVDVIVKYIFEESIFSVEFADNDKNFRTQTTQSYSYGEYVHHDLKVGRLNSLRYANLLLLSLSLSLINFHQLFQFFTIANTNTNTITNTNTSISLLE